MILYHSSDAIVKSPDIVHSREYLDFGRGFYLTSIREQAVKYGQRFVRRGRPAWVNCYQLVDNLDNWKIHRFESYSKDWLEFVVKCRAGESVENFDMIIGGIANDKVIETLNLFFNDLITADDALGRLKYEKPNIQYCIRSQKMLDNCITFIDCKPL